MARTKIVYILVTDVGILSDDIVGNIDKITENSVKIPQKHPKTPQNTPKNPQKQALFAYITLWIVGNGGFGGIPKNGDFAIITYNIN